MRVLSTSKDETQRSLECFAATHRSFLSDYIGTCYLFVFAAAPPPTTTSVGQIPIGCVLWWPLMIEPESVFQSLAAYNYKVDFEAFKLLGSFCLFMLFHILMVAHGGYFTYIKAEYRLGATERS